MRLCHVSPHLPPDQAANALLPADLGTWAHARGDDVRYVTYAPAQGAAVGREPPGRVVRVPHLRATGMRRALRLDTWPRARAVAAALESAAADADLVHLHSNGLIVEVAAAWAARRRLPCVLTLYGTEIWHYRRRWPVDPFRRAYFAAQAVTFYSRGLLDRARELGLDRPNLSVVYPSVNPAFVPADAATRAQVRRDLGLVEPLVILNVKRLHELAGQRYLIDAFAALARGRSDLRLVICGTGALRQALEAQAAAAGVGDAVTFTGLVANADVARYARAADVFALPSLLEALPTVAVEALAAGTPVVSADHPGGVELHGIFGDDVDVVPRRDVEGLAAALGAAIDSPRRTRPETAARLRTLFSVEAIDAAYREIYARVGR